MKHFWLLLLVVILQVSCTAGSKTTSISNFIPIDAEVVIKTNNIEGLSSNLKNNDFLKKISSMKSYKNLESKLEPLSLLNTENEIIVSLSKISTDSIEFTFVTTNNDSLIDFSDKSDYKSETLDFKPKSIDKISWKEQTFYSIVRDSFFVVSSSLDKIKNLPLTKKDYSSKYELLSNTNTSFSVFIDKKAFSEHPVFLLDSIKTSDFSDFMLLDGVVSQDNIQLNGITKASDSIKSFINVFRGNQPQENQIAKITPSNADGFLSFTFDNYNMLLSNINKFKREKNYSVIDSTLIDDPLFGNVVEIGIVFEGKKHAVVLNSLDEAVTNDALLAYRDVVESYRNIDILSFEKPELFKSAFYPLVSFNDFIFYCVIDNFFVFSNTTDILENIIANYQNNTTLATRNSYQSLEEQLSDASSLLMIFDSNKLSQMLDSNNDFNLKNYKTTAVQFVYDHSFAHTNIVIKKSRAVANINSVSEVFNIKLDSDILTNPQFVSNHTNKQKDIVIQDINNNLYLISNKGEIFWKKKLDGPILGRVEQVDIYKNGRLQLVFATPNRIYVLDRNGKDVGPFPLKFNDAITQPLSVFDYDNNRDYRLLVTQEKSVLMLDLNGKSVKGFGFKSADSKILTQPKHFRIGKKDYIVLKSEEKLYILSRRGSPRVTPKTTTKFSNEEVYVYNGNFTTTSKDGNLFSVDENGNTSTQSLNLNEQHHIDATSKTLASLTDNRLTIKNHKVELDFGIYTAPRIFYINDKIYVTVTDKQTNKVYLFDSLGKSIPNFPVYGSSAIDIENADSDRNLEIVVKSGSDELILYKLN